MSFPTPDPNSTALVTGASSGIGVEFAHELARRGHGIALVARREGRLTELAKEIADRYAVRTDAFACDLADPASRDQLAAAVEKAGLTVEVLVNNAGFGGHSEFVSAAPEGRDVEMVRLNVEAVTDLMARYLPGMAGRGRGAVINVASTAAFQPMPGTATYAATKAFVLSQSEAIHEELKGSGVTVTAVCPGPVRTEFADVAGVDEELSEKAPEFMWTEAKEIATSACAAVDDGKRVTVPGKFNTAGAIAGRMAPRSALLPLVNRGWNR